MRHEYRTPEGRLWLIEDGLIYGADIEVASWVEEKLGGWAVQKMFVGIGAIRPGTAPEAVTVDTLKDDLCAGAYFWDWREDGSDIYWSVVCDDIAVSTPDVIRRVLDYPFRQCKCRRLSSYIDLSNERAVRQAQKLGFKLEGRKRNAAPGGGDVGLFGLLPSECPLLTKVAA